ncbi:hypothetical protein CLV84_4314, partial [Neolewinella xylanilytica]
MSMKPVYDAIMGSVLEALEDKRLQWTDQMNQSSESRGFAP